MVVLTTPQDLKAMLREVCAELLGCSATPAPPKDFLSIEEASEYLNIAVKTIYNLVSRKEIPHYKPGGKKLLFKRAELLAWVQEGRVRSVAEMEAEIEATGTISIKKKGGRR